MVDMQKLFMGHSNINVNLEWAKAIKKLEVKRITTIPHYCSSFEMR